MAFAGARVLEHNIVLYRHNWRGTLFTSFVQPVLFLAGMGLGLGLFIDRQNALVGGVPYIAFLAPGLLAAQAMQTGTFEMTFPVMNRIRWGKAYHGMLATPQGIGDLVVGEIAWVGVRLSLTAFAFIAVMAAFGLVRSPLALLALPAAVLTGLAFAALVMAFAARQKTDTPFSYLFRFVIVPLFLFGGTFFPLDRLPLIVQGIAWLTPLAHGVALTRGLTLGTIDPPAALVHVAFLVVVFAVGVRLAVLSMRRALRV